MMLLASHFLHKVFIIFDGKQKEWIVGRPPPKIAEHSRIKLKIYEQYLQEYLVTITQLGHPMKIPLHIVDGFAGGGLYADDIFGSPLRILETINKTIKNIEKEREAKKKGQIDFDIKYYFIESNLEHFRFLEKTLSDTGYLPNANIRLINGQFEKYVDWLVSLIGDKRALFILDQFGFTDVSANTVKKILSGKKMEVILTLSIDGIYRNIYNDNMAFDIESFIPNIRDNKHLSQKQIQEYIVKYLDFNLNSTMFYKTPFLIKGSDRKMLYSIVHLSKHYKARDVMMGVYYNNGNNSFSYKSSLIDGVNCFYEEYQNTLSIHDFNDESQAIKTLIEEVPKKIFDNHKDGIKVKDFLQVDCKESIVPKRLMLSALQELLDYKDISININKKSKRNKATRANDDDVIKPNKTKRFFNLK